MAAFCLKSAAQRERTGKSFGVRHSGVSRTARAATVAPWRDSFPRHFPEPRNLPLHLRPARRDGHGWAGDCHSLKRNCFPFVGPLDVCLSGAEGGGAFSIAT